MNDLSSPDADLETVEALPARLREIVGSVGVDRMSRASVGRRVQERARRRRVRCAAGSGALAALTLVLVISQVGFGHGSARPVLTQGRVVPASSPGIVADGGPARADPSAGAAATPTGSTGSDVAIGGIELKYLPAGLVRRASASDNTLGPLQSAVAPDGRAPGAQSHVSVYDDGGTPSATPPSREVVVNVITGPTPSELDNAATLPGIEIVKVRGKDAILDSNAPGLSLKWVEVPDQKTVFISVKGLDKADLLRIANELVVF